MPGLLTTAQAADHLQLHPVTIRRMASQGRLPGAVRVGARWRFDPERLTDPIGPAPAAPSPARPSRRLAPVPSSLDAAFERHRPRTQEGG